MVNWIVTGDDGSYPILMSSKNSKVSELNIELLGHIW